MPYITKDKRLKIESAINVLVDLSKLNEDDEIEGVMNYIITELGNRCMKHSEWRYKWINRFVGVLECVKLEFYRRLASNYEEKTIEKNGDIPAYEKYVEKNSESKNFDAFP